MNKIKIKIFTFFCLIITLPLVLSSCDSLWDDLNTLPTFTITYVSDKGTAPESKTVEKGYKLTAEDLPTLTENGYRFINWDKVVGDVISSDTTITASWIKIWTITYNSNSGSGTMEPQEFIADVPQALKENTFTREGYTFAGWATSADATTAEYADKAEFTAKENITLYAIWNIIPPAPEPSKVTITYVSDKGTLPESNTVEQGYKLTIEDLPTLTENGYRFINWDKVVGDEISSDITITANWIKTWTITYASNKTELKDKLPASKIVDEGYKLTADDLTTLTADGYNFKGWDKSAGDVISSDTTITATWKKLVTITYASNKTELNNTLPASKTVDEGYKLTSADLSTLTADGYNFKGWDKSAGDVISSNTTITANWKKLFTISYASNKTELNNKLPASKIVDEGYKLTADDLSTLTADGYNFKGWDKSAGLEIKADVTITATWKKLWTITYASNKTELNNKLPASKTVDEGYKLTSADLSTLTAVGYRFINWDKVVGDEISSDTTITATWKKLVTISYASNKTELNNKLPASKTVDEGYKLTSADLISTLTADGYRFINWDKVVGDVISSDTTITATWKKLVTISYASNKSELNNKLPASKTVDEGYKLTSADLSTLTANGYNFKGWDKSAGDVISSNTTITANWKKLVTISYSSTYGTEPDNKTVEEGYTLTATDLPDLGETSDKYFDSWDKSVGAVITADTTITTITANWEDIVCLKKLTSISEISSNKSKIEKIVFTSDTYSGAATTIDCSDTAGYFTGVLTDGTVSGQYILTVYGNGHRIYAPIDCSQLFANYQKLTTIEFNNFYTSKTTNMTGMFAMSNTLNSLNVSSFNTAKVTNMTGMFTGYKGTELNLSNFDTSKVENMQNMFQACTNLTTLNISSFNTSAVTNMFNMFYGCSSLTSLDVSKFVTAKVTNMKQMFADCYGLEELDLSNFDTSEVTDMSLMFSCYNTNKTNLKKIIFSSTFKTDKVTTFERMFYRCEKLTELDISSFSSSAITNIKEMFSTCSELKTIYASSGFDLSGLTSNNTNVFSGDTKLKGGNDTTCDGTNNIDNAYAHIDEGTSNPGYFTLKQ